MDKVSIVIPVYNCKYVDQAIESALNQTYPNIEIIVVNDGSTEYLDKIEKYQQQIIIIHKKNGGTATALNAGIVRATGNYIAWLSADDLFYPDKTEKQLMFMKEKNASVSYGGFVHIDEDGRITTDVLGLHLPDRISFLQALKSYCPVNGCTVMLKKEVFQRCGLFNPAFSYAHDYDMWNRLVQHYHFHVIREPLVKYRIHREMGTKNHFKEIQREVQRIKMKYRHALNSLIAREMQNRNSQS